MKTELKVKQGKSTANRAAVHGGIALLAVAFVPPAAASELALMPMPKSVEIAQGNLPVSGPLSVTIEGCAAAPTRPALARFERDLRLLTGSERAGAPVSLAVRCAALDPQLLTTEAREGYGLSITANGIALDAAGETGVLRGLATLRQLVDRDAAGANVPLVRIDDSPRFVWRGLMVDVARHFMSVETLKRQIDAMELAKLNVLHLHLSDNEAFRVESRKYPRLAGASRDKRTYSRRRSATWCATRAIAVFASYPNSTCPATTWPR